MGEQWKNEATFRTMSDERVHVRITPDWDVFINNDDEPRSNLSGHAAVVLGGFVASLDTIIPYADIYRMSDEAYRSAVENKLALPLEGMPESVTARDFGKYVHRIIVPVRTPFKTNIMQFNPRTLKKVLLACSNTYDDEFVRSIIKGTELFEDEYAKAFFIRNLLTEYERKKSTGTAIAIAVRIAAASKEVSSEQDSDTTPQDSPLFGDDQELIAENQQISDASISFEDTLPIDSLQVITEDEPTTVSEETIVSTEDAEGQNIVLLPKYPIVPEFTPSKDVVKTVGTLIFKAEAGTTFTEDEIKELVMIRTSDIDKIRSALFALTNAGFLRVTVREMGTFYVRLDRQKPTNKD